MSLVCSMAPAPWGSCGDGTSWTYAGLPTAVDVPLPAVPLQEQLKQQRIAEREAKEKQKEAEREAKERERKKRAKENEKRRANEEVLRKEEQERLRKVRRALPVSPRIITFRV